MTTADRLRTGVPDESPLLTPEEGARLLRIGPNRADAELHGFASLRAYVQRAVDAAPPLTAQQHAKLARLLRETGVGQDQSKDRPGG